MRAVIQRVTRASVAVNGGEPRPIGPGLVILLGVRDTDDIAIVPKLAEKCAHLRIFEDEEKFPIASVGGLRCTDTMRHAWGAAVDINPDANCAADRVDGAVKITVGQGWWPLGTEKSEWAGTLAEPSPYSIAAGGSVVRAFAAYGWGWGGTWQSSRDFMHFSVRTDGG